MKFSLAAVAAIAGLAHAFPSKFTLIADNGNTVLTDNSMCPCSLSTPGEPFADLEM